MKRFVVLIMIVGLVAGSVATAEAAKKKKVKKVERVVEGAYDAPSLIAVGTCSQTGAIGCVAIVSAANERFVSAEVTDQTGQPVYVSIQGDSNGDAQDDINYGTFCGKTAAPIAVDPGVTIHFWVGVTPDPGIAGCVPGAATTGTLKATFSNLP